MKLFFEIFISTDNRVPVIIPQFNHKNFDWFEIEK